MRLSIPMKRAIQKLLRRSVAPVVKVRSSEVQGAGLGVFATQPITKEDPVCFYPGVFSPGLPRALSDATYFGNTSLPSGVHPPEMNAYILNLKSTGGYLDGLATGGMTDNPVACAQLVNHNRQRQNVHVVSFWWYAVLDDMTSFDADDEFYRIPNQRRCDGAPRFFHNNEMVYFEKHTTTHCAGAVLCASRDLADGEELYLDYGLQQPLPPWARGWYDSTM